MSYTFFFTVLDIFWLPHRSRTNASVIIIMVWCVNSIDIWGGNRRAPVYYPDSSSNWSGVVSTNTSLNNNITTLLTEIYKHVWGKMLIEGAINLLEWRCFHCNWFFGRQNLSLATMITVHLIIGRMWYISPILFTVIYCNWATTC